MCRANDRTRDNDKIKGKVYRCPKGEQLTRLCLLEIFAYKLQDICSLVLVQDVNPRPALPVTEQIL